MMKDIILKEIVQKHPETQLIMDKYRIDYHAGAYDTLEEAAMILGLSVDKIDHEVTFIVD